MTRSLGTPGTLTVKIGGRSIERLLEARWSECVHSGTALDLGWLADADEHPPEPGAVVDVEWSAGTDPRSEGSLKLWVWSVRHRVDHRGTRLRIRAADPLAFCAEETQLRAHGGHVTLGQLVTSVLDFQPGRLEGCVVDSKPDQALPQEWLLQCEEAGAAFLRRIAASVGHAPFWSRDRLVFAEMGRPPGGAATKLTVGENVHVIEQRSAMPPALRQLVWTHPVSRTLQSEALAALQGPQIPGARGLSRAAHTIHRPPAPAWLARDLRRPRDRSLLLQGGDASWRPGLRVETDGQESVLERVRHAFRIGRKGAAAEYRSIALAVPASMWALPLADARYADAAAGMRGPFQAVVTENRDPERLGRLRVALWEDPDRRSSHWIPWLTSSAGEGTGCHWLPEKGELVTVLAPGACPEDLLAIGALRGSKTRASAAWDSADNAIKVFAFRNGLELRVDDTHQHISLRTRGATLTLEGDGTWRLDGQQLHGSFNGPANLRTTGVLSLDGSRINLG